MSDPSDPADPTSTDVQPMAQVLIRQFGSGQRTSAGFIAFGAIISLLAISFLTIRVAYVALRPILTGKGSRDSKESVFFRTHLGAYAGCLLFANLLSNSAGLIEISWSTQGRIILDNQCNAQAALLQIGDNAAAYFTGAMGIHAFNSLVLVRKSPVWLTSAILITGWFFAILMGTVVRTLQRDAQGPFFAPVELYCWISNNYPAAQFGLRFFAIIFVAGTSVIIYAVIFLCLRGTLILGRRAGQKGIKINLNANQSEVSICPEYHVGCSPGYCNFLNTVAKTMLWFPIAYVLQYLPLVISRLLVISGNSVSFMAFGFSATSVQFLGFTNVIVLFKVLKVLGPAYSNPRHSPGNESFFIPEAPKPTPQFVQFSRDIDPPAPPQLLPAPTSRAASRAASTAGFSPSTVTAGLNDYQFPRPGSAGSGGMGLPRHPKDPMHVSSSRHQHAFSADSGLTNLSSRELLQNSSDYSSGHGHSHNISSVSSNSAFTYGQPVAPLDSYYYNPIIRPEPALQRDSQPSGSRHISSSSTQSSPEIAFGHRRAFSSPLVRELSLIPDSENPTYNRSQPQHLLRPAASFPNNHLDQSHKGKGKLELYAQGSLDVGRLTPTPTPIASPIAPQRSLMAEDSRYPAFSTSPADYPPKPPARADPLYEPKRPVGHDQSLLEEIVITREVDHFVQPFKYSPSQRSDSFNNRLPGEGDFNGPPRMNQNRQLPTPPKVSQDSSDGILRPVGITAPKVLVLPPSTRRVPQPINVPDYQQPAASTSQVAPEVPTRNPFRALIEQTMPDSALPSTDSTDVRFSVPLQSGDSTSTSLSGKIIAIGNNWPTPSTSLVGDASVRTSQVTRVSSTIDDPLVVEKMSDFARPRLMQPLEPLRIDLQRKQSTFSRRVSALDTGAPIPFSAVSQFQTSDGQSSIGEIEVAYAWFSVAPRDPRRAAVTSEQSQYSIDHLGTQNQPGTSALPISLAEGKERYSTYTDYTDVKDGEVTNTAFSPVSAVRSDVASLHLRKHESTYSTFSDIHVGKNNQPKVPVTIMKQDHRGDDYRYSWYTLGPGSIVDIPVVEPTTPPLESAAQSIMDKRLSLRTNLEDVPQSAFEPSPIDMRPDEQQSIMDFYSSPDADRSSTTMTSNSQNRESGESLVGLYAEDNPEESRQSLPGRVQSLDLRRNDSIINLYGPSRVGALETVMEVESPPPSAGFPTSAGLHSIIDTYKRKTVDSSSEKKLGITISEGVVSFETLGSAPNHSADAINDLFSEIASPVVLPPFVLSPLIENDQISVLDITKRASLLARKEGTTLNDPSLQPTDWASLIAGAATDAEFNIRPFSILPPGQSLGDSSTQSHYDTKPSQLQSGSLAPAATSAVSSQMLMDIMDRGANPVTRNQTPDSLSSIPSRGPSRMSSASSLRQGSTVKKTTYKPGYI